MSNGRSNSGSTSVDLSTTYLGFKLPHPFMPGSSPLADTLENVRRLEDAGAAMIVLRSLFAEQVSHEEVEDIAHPFRFMADAEEFTFTPDQYLEHIRKVRKAVDPAIPIVGSLNLARLGGWLEYARLIEDAGANALELNIYRLVTDIHRDANRVEKELQEIVAAAKQRVDIPIAVKLLPFYTTLVNLANNLTQAGADSLILFNRFYQPDIDIEEMRDESFLKLSSSSELLLRLRWIALLHGRVETDIALTGGVHTAQDAIKGMMCGASAVQIVTALFKFGIDYLGTLREHLSQWLEENDYASLDAVKGTMSLCHFSEPDKFERAYYMQVLQRWKT